MLDKLNECIEKALAPEFKPVEDKTLEVDKELDKEAKKEIKEEEVKRENTNKTGAFICRAEGKYACHASDCGGAVKYCSTLDAAYNFLEKHYHIDREDIEYIK